MSKLWMLLGIGLLMGCSDAPAKSEIRCQSGHGTCYVVHCETRSHEKCASYFQGFCHQGFNETTYGPPVMDDHGMPTGVDRLVECK